MPAIVIAKKSAPLVPLGLPATREMEKPPAAPLFPKTVLEPTDFSQELSALRERMPRIFEEAASQVRKGILPLLGWGLGKDPVLHLDESISAKPWYFIGDIHGDVLALHTLLSHVRKNAGFHLCFLGDLVDRGPFSAECLALLLEFAMDHPKRVLWILGNHDESLRYLYSPTTLASLAFAEAPPQADRKFAASVEPAEFAQWLNESGTEREPIGRLFVEVCRGLPRAALFSDGLLATHGGVPLEDLWNDLVQRESLYQERALLDFTWVRLCDQPSKKGWKLDATKRKSSSDFQMGVKDLENFQDRVKEWLPFHSIVRGHDHFETGHANLKNSKKIQVITLTGFGFANSVGGQQMAVPYRSYLTLGLKPQGKASLSIQEVTVNPKAWENLNDPKGPNLHPIDIGVEK
jgi:hypothetical protein